MTRTPQNILRKILQPIRLWGMLIFAIVQGSQIHAQVKISSVDSTESRCAKSGTIVVSTSGGNGGNQYSLIAPSVETRTNQSSSTFNALAAGSYTVKVTDNAGTSDSIRVSIPGNYTQPTFTVVTTQALCNDSTGSVRFVLNSGGRNPLRYNINSGPILRNWQSSNRFNDLESGKYSAQIEDSCGTLRNVSFTISDTLSGTLQGQVRIVKQLGCDSFEIRVDPTSGIPPYKVQLKSSTDSSSSLANPYAYFYVRMDTDYDVIISDRCNKTYKISLTKSKSISMVNGSRVCAGQEVQIKRYYKGIDNPVQHCTKFGIEDTSTKKVQWQNSSVFTIQLGKGYRLYSIDTCCNDTIKAFVFRNKPSTKYQVAKKLPTSLDSTGGIQISLIDLNIPSSLVLIKSPFGANDSFTTSVKQSQKGPLPANYQLGDTVLTFFVSSSTISNLPQGDYKFELRDTCGNRDTLEFSILSSDLYYPKQSFTIQKGCPGDHSIHYKIDLSQYFGFNIARVFLKGLPLNNTISSKRIDYMPSPVSIRDSFTSLGAGTYLLETQTRGFSTNFIGTDPAGMVDTIVLTDPGYPAFKKISAYGCKNGKISVVAEVAEGLPPFSFRIKADTSTTWSAKQDSGIFSDVDRNIYDVELTDACGNITTSKTTGSYLSAPQLHVQYACDEDTLRLKGTSIFGGVYEWSKSGNFISSDSFLEFKPYATPDYGNYALKVYLGNANGICVDTTVNINVGQGVITKNPELSSCDSLQYRGLWYKSDGIIRDTLRSQFGCDSITETPIKVHLSKQSNVSLSDCDSLRYASIWYYSDTVLVDTLKTDFLCDSLIRTTIHIDKSSFSKFSYESCDSINLNGSWYFSTQTVRDTFKNATLCDSIVNWELLIQTSPQSFIDLVSCDSALVNQNWYYATQIVKDVLKSASNCDSVVWTNLTINRPNIIIQTIEDCDSVLSNGTWYYSNNQESKLWVNQFGCDSMVLTNITVHPSIERFESLDVCDSAFIEGNWYKQSQEVISPLKSSTGCDSTIYTDIIIRSSTASNQFDTICKGQPYTLPSGEIVKSSGVYVTTFDADNGCDSLAQVHLTVAPCDPCSIYLPSAFTPNDNNLNEYFRWGGNCTLLEFDLQIYNRWGQKVFESSNENDLWDGTYLGTPVQSGVYLYLIHYITHDGFSRQDSGLINLLR